MKKGFTLAEVLITLAVIGIVAAISLPSLTGTVNEKAWDAQKRALHARLAQAVGQMKDLSVYENSEDFVVNGLNKVYKLNAICGVYDGTSCNFPSTIKTFRGNEYLSGSLPEQLRGFIDKSREINAVETDNGRDTMTGAINPEYFTTVNGESVAAFYNNLCGEKVDPPFNVSGKMCVNFIYDLNGTKGPNQFGKDIGTITAFYRKEPVVVAPYYIIDNSGLGSGEKNTRLGSGTVSTINSKNGESVVSICQNKTDGRAPNMEELMALFINSKGWDFDEQKRLSSTMIDRGKGAALTTAEGAGEITAVESGSFQALCIEK